MNGTVRRRAAFGVLSVVALGIAVYGYNVARNDEAREQVRSHCARLREEAGTVFTSGHLSPFFEGEAERVQRDLRAQLADVCRAVAARLDSTTWNIGAELRVPVDRARSQRLRRAFRAAAERCPNVMRNNLRVFVTFGATDREMTLAVNEICEYFRDATTIIGSPAHPIPIWDWPAALERTADAVSAFRRRRD